MTRPQLVRLAEGIILAAVLVACLIRVCTR
jgi:hypothetical protein